MTRPIHSSFLDKEIEHLSNAITNGLKEHHDFSKIEGQIRTLMILHGRKLGILDRDSLLDFELEIKQSANLVKDTYNPWSSLGISIISALMVAGGGVTGATSLLSAIKTTQKSLTTTGQFLSTAGQGTGSFAQIFNNKSEAERTIRQLRLKEIERKRDQRQQDVSQTRAQTQQMQKELADCYARIHQLISQLLVSQSR